MKFYVDIHDGWPLASEPEFIRIQPSGIVYLINEYHESRRTPRRLVCEVESLGKIDIGDSARIECVRYKRKRRKMANNVR